MRRGYVKIQFHFTRSKFQMLNEWDSTLVRAGIVGEPDYDESTIKIKKAEAREAMKHLKGVSYSFRSV